MSAWPAIGIHGNFTAQQNNGSASCTTSTSSTSSSSNSSGRFGGGEDPNSYYQPQWCRAQFGTEELVFYPNSTTSQSTTSNCETGTMNTTYGGFSYNSNNNQGDNNYQGYNNNHHLELAPGACVVLTFTGTISFGYHSIVVVPSTLSGQQYIVQVIASDSTPVMLNCTLPLSSTSCTPLQNNFGQSSGGD